MRQIVNRSFHCIMPDWLDHFLNGPGAAMLAAASGFFGSLVLLSASWRSLALREAQHEVDMLDAQDPTLERVRLILAKQLAGDQLVLIAGERRLYRLGITLLGLSFLISFVRELV
ncbi:MAG: hypothetical protein JNM75_01680 [Rhodospirillales bacterium]|nr:hypothetical protein [Rhodospirillales bacterium]